MTSADTATISLVGIALFTIFGPSPFLTNAFAQSNSVESSMSYNSSYKVTAADVTIPVTIEAENHVYQAGDEVRVTGFVWIELVNRIDTLDLITLEAKDGQGNIIARENATIGSDGKYSTSFRLLEGASSGTYTVQARIELEADALGLVEAITSAALQSSTEFVVADPAEHKIMADNQEFNVVIASNSGINEVTLNQEDKKLSFLVEGSDGTTGVTEISIPKAMLSGDMTVLIDQNIAIEDDVLLKLDTATETVFEINYKHSIHIVEVAGTNVVPEFPLAIVIMAITIGAMIVVSTVAKRGGNWNVSGR
jgi:hypothetical protein